MDFVSESQLLNHKALYIAGTGNFDELILCTECEQYLNKLQVPPLSLANGFNFKYPTDLPVLNFIETLIISRLQIQSGIVKLSQFKKCSSQLAFKGHFITKPQNPDKLLDTLPLPLSVLKDTLYIIFVQENRQSVEPTLAIYSI